MVSRPACGAAVDRYESDRQRHTSVINLDTTRNNRRVVEEEEESRSVSATTTADYGQDDDYSDYYYDDEYEDSLSGDYEEVPRGKRVYIYSHFSCGKKRP